VQFWDMGRHCLSSRGAVLHCCVASTLCSLPWCWWAGITPLRLCWREQPVSEGQGYGERTSAGKLTPFLCVRYAKPQG